MRSGEPGESLAAAIHPFLTPGRRTWGGRNFFTLSMNPLGTASVVCSILAFALTYHLLRLRSLQLRLAYLFGFALLAIPSVLFAVFYLHVLPERAWFYTLRTWSG